MALLCTLLILGTYSTPKKAQFSDVPEEEKAVLQRYFLQGLWQAASKARKANKSLGEGNDSMHCIAVFNLPRNLLLTFL